MRPSAAVRLRYIVAHIEKAGIEDPHVTVDADSNHEVTVTITFKIPDDMTFNKDKLEGLP